MNRYEEKKQARVERYRKHAEQAKCESAACYQRSNEIAKAFEGGQPIIVGHHSEVRARRDQKKIWDNMEKSVEAGKKAAYYEAKAEAAENNQAIYSDDPEAIQKLSERLEELTEVRNYKKRVNAYYRKHKTCKGCEDVSDEHVALLDNRADRSFDKTPFHRYEFTNLSGNINRVKKRIAVLEASKENPPADWDFAGGRVCMNREENRVQIFFDSIPSQEFRQFLHRNIGFRWSRYHGAWQRQISDAAIRAAHTATERFLAEEA
ncbi:DUF3560 domain-containing protein [Enterocloster clostridioformis]|uniref:DUF3560 domain-containing protein n=1 Tax=Enterocloster clostridioformis TaxID=1531 RepID=UPI002675E899|nr:DUF3560 domain-containing protein [Enterocloster clostridioformis]